VEEPPELDPPLALPLEEPDEPPLDEPDEEDVVRVDPPSDDDPPLLYPFPFTTRPCDAPDPPDVPPPSGLFTMTIGPPPG
jgi:hypothetical protein